MKSMKSEKFGALEWFPIFQVNVERLEHADPATSSNIRVYIVGDFPSVRVSSFSFKVFTTHTKLRLES